jgi:AcrR family transcriptional regulator
MAEPVKRARQEWQKEARGRDILDAAAQLFVRDGRLPAMADVAARAGIAKGTLYLYFRGREALWLELLDAGFGRWVDWVEQALGDRATVDDAVDAIVSGAEVDPLLIPIATHNASLIEPHAAPEAAARFKATTAGHIGRLAAFLAPRLGLGIEDATRRVLHSYALLLGLWQVANQPAVVRALIASDAALGYWSLDWRDEARAGLAALWRAGPAHG